MRLGFDSEDGLVAGAARLAKCWRDAGLSRLTVGLSGELGAGKTTWVRAMLRALGHQGRVPSPTYTLLEHYAVGELTLVHLDLYRIGEAGELEFLGLRDWIGRDAVWILAEWPERAAPLMAALDLAIGLTIESAERRAVDFDARSQRGSEALAFVRDFK